MNKLISITVCIFAISALLILSGCSNDIQFNRESAMDTIKKTKFYQEQEEQKKENKKNTTVTKSRGMVIYHAGQDSNQKSDIKFGPEEINFSINK